MKEMTQKITKPLKAFAALAFAMVLALALFGCSQSDSNSNSQTAASADGITFTDDEGNTVTIASDPQRVVAAMGSFARMWELAGGTLVGASDDAFTSYTIASDAEMIGDFTDPNLEAIIALDPDFVILTSGSGGRGGNSSQVDLKDALESSNIPYAYFNVTTFDDYERMMKILTDITGRSDLYEENVSAVADEIAQIVSTVPGDSNPTVALMISYSGGVRLQNSATQTGAILAGLGATNIADENPSLLSDFSVEALLEVNPDFIFVLPMGNTAEAAQNAMDELISSDPAWESLKAVEDDHLIILEPDLYLYKPNEKWAEPYAELYAYLYE